MRYAGWLTVAALVFAVATACSGADRQQGDSQGLVVGVQKVKSDKGDAMSLTLLTKGMTRLTFLVPATERGAYDTASKLKTNASVHVYWWSEGGTNKWVSRIDMGGGK